MEMVGDSRTVAASRVPPPELRFSRITDRAGVRLPADINSEAYGLSLDAGRAGTGRRYGLGTESFSFVALRGDEPVAVCSTRVLDGCPYLARVATRPDVQKKGYASAVVGHALRQAHLATGSGGDPPARDRPARDRSRRTHLREAGISPVGGVPASPISRTDDVHQPFEIQGS